MIILVVFAILLILPAAVLRALNIAKNDVFPFMLLPSGMLLGVVVVYVIHNRKDKCCAKCGGAERQLAVQTPLTQPALIVDRQPDTCTPEPNVTQDNKNGADNENSSHKETDILLT